jgi:peroxiredoxin
MTSDTLLWGLVVASLVAVTLLGLLVIALLRSYASIVKVLHDAGIKITDEEPSPSAGVAAPEWNGAGRPATDLSGETLEGGIKALSVSGGESHLLVAFLSSGCAACVSFWRALRSNQGRLPDLDAQVVVVTKGPEKEEPAKLAELTGDRVEVLMSDESWDAYQVPLTPHFVLVDRASGRVIGEGSSSDPESLAQLMRRAAADARQVTRRELLTRQRGGDRG